MSPIRPISIHLQALQNNSTRNNHNFASRIHSLIWKHQHRFCKCFSLSFACLQYIQLHLITWNIICNLRKYWKFDVTPRLILWIVDFNRHHVVGILSSSRSTLPGSLDLLLLLLLRSSAEHSEGHPVCASTPHLYMYKCWYTAQGERIACTTVFN